MITKNLEVIQRTVTRLESILETDEGIGYTSEYLIKDVILDLQEVIRIHSEQHQNTESSDT